MTLRDSNPEAAAFRPEEIDDSVVDLKSNSPGSSVHFAEAASVRVRAMATADVARYEVRRRNIIKLFPDLEILLVVWNLAPQQKVSVKCATLQKG